ncbi:hypothetical protein MRX96_030828 [Rhipicephalus microplus]
MLETVLINGCSFTDDVFVRDAMAVFELLQPSVAWIKLLMAENKPAQAGLVHGEGRSLRENLQIVCTASLPTLSSKTASIVLEFFMMVTKSDWAMPYFRAVSVFLIF